jgi:exoribonuclease R
MRALVDPNNALKAGLGRIRRQFQIPDSFPPAVLAAAEAAAGRAPAQHADRTAVPFVTLDPKSATDLDQAFVIERNGSDLLLRYAIADVAWFVDDGGVIDAEAWRRGATQYLPDGKASLYPHVLSQGAASLLPGGPRPAVVFTVRVAPDGEAQLDGAERALIRSAAKLAYDAVQVSDLPAEFAELSDRVQIAEARRGAARVDPPEQEVADLGDDRLQLRFRPRLETEDRNAALSLSANLAIAQALQAHATGLFRVMPEPDARAVKRLRLTALALGLHWPRMASLAQFEKSLHPKDPKQAAFMLAVRRASQSASYEPYQDGVTPWHAAMGATYAHATAPLRRLADRYVVQAALAIANGKAVPQAVSDAFVKLPAVMAKAAAYGGQIDRAVVDLAETVMLGGREGEIFDALVTDVDERGARMQLCDLPVVARIAAPGAAPGEDLRVRLSLADPDHPPARFEPVP